MLIGALQVPLTGSILAVLAAPEPAAVELPADAAEVALEAGAADAADAEDAAGVLAAAEAAEGEEEAPPAWFTVAAQALEMSRPSAVSPMPSLLTVVDWVWRMWCS